MGRTFALHYIIKRHKNEMNGVLGNESALLMLYWAGDNLSKRHIIAYVHDVGCVYMCVLIYVHVCECVRVCVLSDNCSPSNYLVLLSIKLNIWS